MSSPQAGLCCSSPVPKLILGPQTCVQCLGDEPTFFTVSPKQPSSALFPAAEDGAASRLRGDGPGLFGMMSHPKLLNSYKKYLFAVSSAAQDICSLLLRLQRRLNKNFDNFWKYLEVQAPFCHAGGFGLQIAPSAHGGQIQHPSAGSLCHLQGTSTRRDHTLAGGELIFWTASQPRLLGSPCPKGVKFSFFWNMK